MADAEIRELSERDIDAAIRLTDLEGWGYTPADFRRLMELSPGGCLAVERDGAVLGVLSTTSYGPVAYLGAVILDPNARGQGLGRRLMDAALVRLERGGVGTVVLHAYLNVIPFYEKLGFARETENGRWQGPAGGRSARHVHPVRIEDLDRLSAFDAPVFGADRRRLLSHLMREFPETFMVAEAGTRIVGYLVGNPSESSTEIGPWLVDPSRPSVAEDLFAALCRASGAEEVAFSGPLENEAVTSFTRRHGFRELFRTLRMARGPDAYRGRPEGVWAYAGLEKG